MGLKERIVLVSSMLLAIGGGAMSAYASVVAPTFAQFGFWGGLAVLILGVVGILWATFHKDKNEMSDHKGNPDLEVGDESVVYGNVRGRIGNRSVVVGSTHGADTILNQAPFALGHGAYAGPGSIAIGTNAGAGSRPRREDENNK